MIQLNSLNIFNELSEHIGLRIHSCNEALHPQGWVESKVHKDYDLWLLRKGQIEIRIDNNVHLATEGDLILFNPKAAYTATTTMGNGCEFVFIHFDFGLGNHLRILDNFHLSGIVAGSLAQEEIQLFLNAYEQHRRGASMSGIRLKGCFTILISKIMERYGLGEYRGEFMNNPSRRSMQTNSLHALQSVFDYIQEHLHHTIRIPELAILAGMSEKYFILYFKQAVGITPGLYMYQLRMNRARELLYTKNYTIQQIAGMLGYPDPYSFSKAFKKLYKVPPSQFVW